jgi:hypothetical protein
MGQTTPISFAYATIDQIGTLRVSFNTNTSITTTFVAEYLNVIETNPTLEIATKFFIENKLHFKKIHKD